MAAFTIYADSFIDELVRTKRGKREDLLTEFREAARRAAVRRFGDATPIVVTFDKMGAARFWQEIEVVAEVADARRQVAKSALEEASPGMAAKAGDIIRFPICYTAGGDQYVQNEEQLAPLLPLPLHDDTLWDALNEELNALVQKYFPPPPHKAGSMGEVLASGGGWLKGLSVSVSGVTLTVERTYFDFLTLEPTRGWVDYGFVLSVEQDGQPSVKYEPHRGDNDCNVQSWIALASTEAALERFLAQLQTLAGQIAERGTGWYSGNTVCTELISAALRPAAPGSLLEWFPSALKQLEGYRKRVVLDGGSVTFKTLRVFAPEIGMGHEYAKGAIRLTAEVMIDGKPVSPSGKHQSDVISLGYVTPQAAEDPGPRTEEEQRDADRIIATFRDWLDEHLERYVPVKGLDAFIDGDFFYAFPGVFPLVELIENRLALGPAGPPPVPPFDKSALERAGRLLAPVRGAARLKMLRQLRAEARRAVSPDAEAQKVKGLEAAGWQVNAPEPSDEDGEEDGGMQSVIAVFLAQGWTILLTDELEGSPFRLPSIELVPPEGGPVVTVLMVDAWNPAARTVVDGDAFAFRRFVTWLREGILCGGHDSKTVWVLDEDECDEDEEGEGADNHKPGTLELSVSDWLLFGIPYFGDRFLVDWRTQWDIVNAVRKTENMAGMYGFTGGYVDHLRKRDIPQWRRFLREVIDPRFDLTWGARLVKA